MGKKGSKRKTQWRTLSLDTPPGEDDDEEAKKPAWSGYEKGHEPWRSGYSNGGSRHRDGSSDLRSQPKVIFNEEEYTRITTPRQDILFKKGYLMKNTERKTSATSSTTGSQSASHSTADGSETTEYQQLLDRDCRSSRDCRTAKYPPALASSTELNYNMCYDHTAGCYYYPVMVVGPTPVPMQVAPNVLAAVPCGPVPLRPIEWINPIFMPKVPGQPYCMMDYKSDQSEKEEEVTEKYEHTELPMENYDGNYDENGTGSASYSGSVVYEIEEQPVETNNEYGEIVNDEVIEEPTENAMEENEQQFVEEQLVENGVNDNGSYYEPMLMGQPVHVSHVIPAAPQPYMYPGHYMFGPPLINVNGVTIQGGSMMRSMDMTAMWTAYTKQRKKKKRWRQEKHAADNAKDDKEREYSSEYDTGMSSFRLSCTASSTSTTTTTTTNCRPLNPECQEFHLRQAAVESYTSIPSSSPTNSINSPASDQSSMNRSNVSSSDTNFVDNDTNDPLNGNVSDDSRNPDDKLTESAKSDPADLVESDAAEQTFTLIENGQSTSPEAINLENETNRLTICSPENVEEAVISTNEVVYEVEKLPSAIKPTTVNDSSNINDLRPSNEMNGGECLVNGKLDSDSNNEDASDKIADSKASSPLLNDEKSRSRSVTPKSVENVASRENQNHESLANNKLNSSINLSKRKYSAKGTKFVREPTPGPDLDSTTEIESDAKIYNRTQGLEKTAHPNDSKPMDPMFEDADDNKTKENKDQLTNNKFVTDKSSVGNHLSKEEAIEASNEDSGFESQTRLSDYPITEAVTEWLRREKSPDLFITSTISMDCEEDEDEMDEEPPKNLQGNPMPALSANSAADNVLSCATSYSEFARFNNVKGVQQEQQGETGNNGASRRKKDPKKRSEERRRVARHAVEGRMDHEVVSSSDSCGQQEDLMNNSRRKNNTARPQQDVVGDVCELTEKDSVAGMRVASSSRMDSKRVNARRTKRQGKLHVRNSMNNMEAKIRRIEDVDDENDVDGNADDNTMNVKTYEKGEIVVSEEGKLLTTSVYEPSLRNHHDLSAAITVNAKCEASKQRAESRVEDNKKSSSSGEDEESCSVIGSLGSIEEPDVLEFWEAEIIEPVITPKRILQSEGVLCEGEAAEDDANEVEQLNVEYVQKYYRLAQESTTSIEEEMNLNADPTTSSKSVPNEFVQKEQGEKEEEEEVELEVPMRKELPEHKNNIPIDEAFEVYESCYTGKPPYLVIDPKIFKSRTLYGQEGEAPVPCRAVCCHIQ